MSLRDAHSAERSAWREKQETPLRPSFPRKRESSVLRLDSGSRPAALPGMMGEIVFTTDITLTRTRCACAALSLVERGIG